MPRYVVAEERTQYYTVVVEAVDEAAARDWRQQMILSSLGHHPTARLVSILEDDDEVEVEIHEVLNVASMVR